MKIFYLGEEKVFNSGPSFVSSPGPKGPGELLPSLGVRRL